LSPGVTRTLSLVFHELLMNATKYDALSNPNGTIASYWIASGDNVQLNCKQSGGAFVSLRRAVW
jgi:two-component sensor histidine kinase